jgi:hypothetical protein
MIVAFGTLLFAAHTANAFQTDSAGCIQDVWQDHGNTQNLTCTANDVQLAEVANICVLTDPNDPNSACRVNDEGKPICTQGTTFTFTADFQVLLTAQTRYDIGVYFASDGGNGDGALTGDCTLTTIDPQNSDNFINIDNPNNSNASGDLCGDIKNTNVYNPQQLHLTLDAFCGGTDANPNQVNLPNCTSWRQSGANELCDEATDAFPGSPSKCNCQPEFLLDIFIEPATANLTKTAKQACVTFEVEVSNPTTTHTLTLTGLSDSVYGNIANQANGLLCDTTCDDAIGSTIAAGSSVKCNFQAKILPDGDLTNTCQAHKDTVTATLDDENGDAIPPPIGSDAITVDLDVPIP